MNINLKTLEINIIQSRENLYKAMKNNNLTDEKVVKYSEELDKLILEYQMNEIKTKHLY
ncbi:hypothetical protein J2Z42_000415 [Clostridium algifaecis]|uniref:Aspartyl-phosphate phosphatase Spo0E family protein n=1 Tax=Clostridium algifaecis TaxID=1472040 RepID=A0ABS4KNZ4_9CLOT|nr:aspartyl-phosphate phosphatase Spo0E family protein [Clostridium algifaecis]MBP2031750.1 hypothetical protein [Clostridium algifaecis]